jgi:hypothetical protein
MQSALVGAGATVITFTLPDLGDIMPIAGLVRSRLHLMNDAIQAACASTGAIVCDFASYPVASDPRLWSGDRLHANSAGHARIADALAWHLKLSGSNLDWAEPLPSLPPPRFGAAVRAESAWVRRHLLPWIWRHARGKSSGDGVRPKYPELTIVRGEPDRN